jgi:hypothetical protein
MKVSMVFPLVLVLSILSSGCGKKGTVQTGIFQLKSAFPSANAETNIVENLPPGSTREVNVNGYVGQAIVALQKNDYVNAVTLLTAVRKQPNLTAEQHMAVHETIEKAYTSLVNRAANGDAQAKAAMAELEKKLAQ